MVTGPTDKDTISVAKAQLFHRFLDVTNDRIIELELVDTGLVASDGISRYALATTPAPLSALSKVTPLEGSLDVAAAATAQCLGERAITGLNQVNQTFDIAGDWTGHIDLGDAVVVAGSTGNDGTYTVATATYAAGTTTIEVNEAIPDATVDGSITLDEVLCYAIIAQAKDTNTGVVAVGSDAILVASVIGVHLSANMVQVFEAPAGKCLDLNDFWCDVAVNGEGIQFTILR